jgi:hypothetical protein
VSGNTIALVIGAWEDKGLQRIWMDGRPHPSALAPHDRGGFTTGEWQGTTLVTFTTHIKTGALRRLRLRPPRPAGAVSGMRYDRKAKPAI